VSSVSALYFVDFANTYPAMAVESVASRNEIENLQGGALVRRFTGELQGETTLERAAISALQEDDAIAEELMEARMQALLEDSDRKSVRNPAFNCVKTDSEAAMPFSTRLRQLGSH
jgi:hypothetical protein